MISERKGKLIVLYGINNLGKSTQAKLLLNNLLQYGHKAEYIKYPIYNLEPTGPKINDILRGGKKQTIPEQELQQLYAQNRFDYQPMLLSKLNRGTHIIAEDYIGTGLAWGVTKGADLVTLQNQNKGLFQEDIAILFDGERFIEGKEAKHLHESNDELMNRCRQVHLDLAKKYHWQIIPANRAIPEVEQEVWKLVEVLIDNSQHSQ